MHMLQVANMLHLTIATRLNSTMEYHTLEIWLYIQTANSSYIVQRFHKLLLRAHSSTTSSYYTAGIYLYEVQIFAKFAN